MLTTRSTLNMTMTRGREPQAYDHELVDRYREIVVDQRYHWTTHHRLQQLLGTGGQGTVYLTTRRGSDGFTLPVALKIFSPERFEDERAYTHAMQRMSRVASQVAQIQHDNLINVQNFFERDRIRMMEMEWIDGYDLRRMLQNKLLDDIEFQVSNKRWDYINRVIVTKGPEQPRIKPGVAVAIVRDCLGALAALHRDGIVHGDIKPSNVMLKRTGNAKIVDMGSAFVLEDPPPQRSCTPLYAAPEVLEGCESSGRSDLASLGYVLIEALSGRIPFSTGLDYRDLLEEKRLLPQRLHQLLPDDVTRNELLMSFCRGLIAPDPMRRFPSAEAADLVEDGAAAFHRQLIKGDMASEYENEIRLWVEVLHDLEVK